VAELPPIYIYICIYRSYKEGSLWRSSPPTKLETPSKNKIIHIYNPQVCGFVLVGAGYPVFTIYIYILIYIYRYSDVFVLWWLVVVTLCILYIYI